MNKKELFDTIYDRLDLTREQVNSVGRSLLEVVQQEVVAGNEVVIPGWGKFSPVVRAARIARNPSRPGEMVNVPERRGVRFKAGKSFKNALNT